MVHHTAKFEIELLQIHKRRLGILEQQQAKVGVHYNATLIMEIEDIKKKVGEIEQYLKRRLQLLHEKAAVYGISADPSVLMEIEDIEAYFKEGE